jgi:hypothetical protein
MTDIRCPMCGKPNPDNLEVCQFCEARLKPLVPTSVPVDEPSSDEKKEGLPEWSSLDWDDDEDDESEDALSLEDENNAQDWLNRIRVDSSFEEESSSELESETPWEDEGSPSGESSDWLQRIRSLHETDQEPQSTSLESQSEDESSTPLPSASMRDSEILEDNEQSIPDWIGRLYAANDEEARSSRKDSESEAEELPDWLTEGLVSQVGETTPPSEDAASLEDDHFFDFLPSLEENEAASTALVDESGTDFGSQKPEANIPDWLMDLGIGGDLTRLNDEESVPEQISKPSDEVPEADGFIPKTGNEMPELPVALGEDETEAEDTAPTWLKASLESQEPDSANMDDLQKWFSDLDEDASLASESEPDLAAPSHDEDMPGWLKNLGSVVTGTIEDDNIPKMREGVISPFVTQGEFGDDMLDVEGLPDWLTAETETAGIADEIDESGLTPAELPGWLEAMRPVEEETPGAILKNGPAERGGPLAGLRNILSAEPEFTQFKKPPVYSAKLRVTDSQQTHANIFSELLSFEGKAEATPQPPLVSSQWVLRWVIAIILTIVVGFVVVSGSQYVVSPSNTAIPETTYASSRIISALPNQAPVLLAFDYEPGTAGEMNATAAALVDHLMLKGARLTLVSTLPTGPALAEYFIQKVLAQHNYTSGAQYINLGYIPGGSMGLLSFAQTPQWVFPPSYNGVNPWETQPLQGIQAISDFALVVVITNDPDSARYWIEQVQPKIGDTPLLAVVSAQAEPMVQPYFGDGQNAQLQGIVSGLTGGAAYEVAVGKANLGRVYWDAFSIGVVIAMGAIVIGGAANVIQQLLAGEKTKDLGKTG